MSAKWVVNWNRLFPSNVPTLLIIIVMRKGKQMRMRTIMLLLLWLGWFQNNFYYFWITNEKSMSTVSMNFFFSIVSKKHISLMTFKFVYEYLEQVYSNICKFSLIIHQKTIWHWSWLLQALWLNWLTKIHIWGLRTLWD